MNRIMLAVAGLAVANPALAAERRFTVTDFDRIQVDGPFEVVLTTGRAPSATATGSNEAIERVSLDVQGRVLRVRTNRSAWGGSMSKSPGPLKIALSTHDLRGAAVTGSGSISIDRAKAMRFDVSVSGTGQIGVVNVDADNLVLGLLGSGKITIGGKAKALRATIQGTGNLEAQGLTANDAEINADTAGSIGVRVKNAAKVTATGNGDVEIIGTPACTVKALGSGRVACGRN